MPPPALSAQGQLRFVDPPAAPGLAAEGRGREGGRSATSIEKAPPLPRSPLHPLVEGKPHPECIRSWFSAVCPHHPGEQKPIRPQLCARQGCETSTPANTLERARDSWDGTAEKNRRGLRHFGGAEWGIFVFTCPDELRPFCVGDKLREFRAAAGDMALEVLRKHAGDDRARFFMRSWLHPEGDKQPGVYKPHENVIVPLVAWHPVRWRAVRRDGRGKERIYLRERNALAFVAGRARPEEWWVEKVKGYGGRVRFMLPKAWLGKDGWICEAWRARLVEIFGQWWSDDEAPPATLPFYEYRDTPEKKMHALKYFARTFPGWAGHDDVPARPRAFDGAHWKHRLIVISRMGLTSAPLPAFDDCAECVAAGEEPPPRVTGFGATSADAEKAIDHALDEHTCATCQREPRRSPYLEHRRSMRAGGRADGPHPTTGPPETARMRIGGTREPHKLTRWSNLLDAAPGGALPEGVDPVTGECP